jgi:hypothetical protein
MIASAAMADVAVAAKAAPASKAVILIMLPVPSSSEGLEQYACFQDLSVSPGQQRRR